MKPTKFISGLLFCILLTACGSTPRSDYYILSADAEGIPGTSGPSLGVGPVTVPTYLNAREMILNRSEHKLKLADYDRWAEPLDKGAERVIAVNLSVLMETANVQLFPWRRDSIPEYAVRVAVVQFAVHGSEARLVCEWAITLPRTGESVSHHISQLTSPAVQNEPETVAAAYSTLLLELSENIAAAINAHIAAAGDSA